MVCTSRLGPSLIHGLCAILPLIHGLCTFLRPLLTLVSTAPFFATFSVHRLHFTVYSPSKKHFRIFFKSALGISLFPEAGRLRFRRARFQTPNSVSFFALAEFWGRSSVSSFRPIICAPKRAHRVFRRTHWVCPKSQWGSVSSLLRSSTLETVFRPFLTTSTDQDTSIVNDQWFCLGVMSLQAWDVEPNTLKTPRKSPAAKHQDHGEEGQGRCSWQWLVLFCASTISWSRGCAERIWGEFFILVWRILGKALANFSANLDSKFRWRMFPVLQAHKKFTSKIHARTCQHSSPISLSRTQNLFTPILCLRGRPIFLSALMRRGWAWGMRGGRLVVERGAGRETHGAECARAEIAQKRQKSSYHMSLSLKNKHFRHHVMW